MPARSIAVRLVAAAVGALGVTVAALVAIPSADAAPTGTVWTGSGPGTTTVVSDGATTPPKFTYNEAGQGPSTWTFSTTATANGTVILPYSYTGFHAFFQVTVTLDSFVTHLGSTTTNGLVSTGPQNCCTPPSGGFDYSGTESFSVQAGDTYGFTFGGSNFDSSAVLSGTLDLGTPQTITFVQPGTHRLGQGDVHPNAVASSALAVTLASTTPAVCTVAGTAVKLLTPGSCSITAGQAGNFAFDPATDVVRSFMVAKGLPTLTGTASGGGPVGTSIFDRATLSGGSAPTGTLSFRLYAAGDTSCAGTPVFTNAVTVTGAGHYQSAAFTPIVVGDYQWVVSYSGNASNDATTGACNVFGQAASIELANTGITNALQLTVAGLIMLLAGAGALVLGRRRA